MHLLFYKAYTCLICGKIHLFETFEIKGKQIIETIELYLSHCLYSFIMKQ